MSSRPSDSQGTKKPGPDSEPLDLTSVAGPGDIAVDDKTKTCHLFRLPAELRNNLYQLIFNVDEDRNVNLLQAQPPPEAALVLVNRQLYAETKNSYTQSRTAYFHGTRYSIRDLERKEDLRHLRTIGLKQHYFSHLTLRGRVQRKYPDRRDCVFSWSPVARMWHVYIPWRRDRIYFAFIQRGFLNSRPQFKFWEVNLEDSCRIQSGEERVVKSGKEPVEMWRQVECIRSWMRRATDYYNNGW